jgi:hypothetical protein
MTTRSPIATPSTPSPSCSIRPSRLVTEQHGHRTHAIAVDDREIRVAQPGRLDAHEDLTRPRRVEVELPHRDGSRCGIWPLATDLLEDCAGDLH